MPQTLNYTPILELASSARMKSFQNTFGPATESELYGVYIWIQHVVGSLYPLTQHIEVALRNAIDVDARKRFSHKWWRRPEFNGAGSNKFQGNIAKSITKLNNEWEKQERKRLNIPFPQLLPSPPPNWSHDQVVGATDFSTWEFILSNAFAHPVNASSAAHLWPDSMSASFRRYDLLDIDSKKARLDLLNLVRELRQYRNRLYHHDKIWASPHPHMTAHDVVHAINDKIDKMELLLKIIDPRLHKVLEKTGVLANTRRICSINELDIYRFAHIEAPMTRRKKRVLRSVTGRARHQNVTQAWAYAGGLYGIYRIR